MDMRRLGERLAACPDFRPSAQKLGLDMGRIESVSGGCALYVKTPQGFIIRHACTEFVPDLDDEATLWLTIAQVVKLRAGIGISMGPSGANIATAGKGLWDWGPSETRDSLAESAVAIMEAIGRNGRT